MRKARTGAPPDPPSSIVSDLDPVVERVVMWCLDGDPARRPSSAQAVAKALPGGDPLAVAMAAGETPSPEMVAAAGGRGGMRFVTAMLWLAGIIVGMLVIAGLNNKMALFRLARLEKPPVVLADRARQVLSDLGLEQEPRGTAFGLGLDTDFLRHIERTDTTSTRWEQLRDTEYPTYLFWYKESPRPLIPFDTGEAKVSFSDPPMNSPGMAYIRLAADGRLLSLEMVGDPAAGLDANPDLVDWSRLFEESGIDPAELESVEGAGLEMSEDGRKWQGPVLAPGVPVDHMEAWIGPSPWDDQDSIRVRAGSLHGKPVFFATEVTYKAAPDSHAAGEAVADTATAAAGTNEEAVDRGASHGAEVVASIVLGFTALALALGVLVGGPLIAWRHIRMGKGDRRGALRFGLFALGLILLSSLLLAHHAVIAKSGAINLGYEIDMIVSKLGTSVLYGAYIALAYLALEPYVRRHWPDALISWTRLVGGRISDPLVGRDMLLGGAAGVFVTLIWQLRNISPAWFGWPSPRPIIGELEAVQGGARAIGHFVAPAFLLPPMLGILALALLVIVLRKRWVALTVLAAVIIGIGAFASLAGSEGADGPGFITLICLAVMVILLLALFLRSGLLALVVTFFFFSKLRRFPLALDSSAWYSGTSTLALLALAAIAIYAFRIAIRGYPKGVATGADSSSIELPPN